MITLSETEKQFVINVLEEAEKNGIKCTLILQKDEIIDKRIVFDSTDGYVNSEKINGYYNTIAPSDVKQPIFEDILSYVSIHRPDANGWLSLFCQSDQNQDGRWFIHIDSDDSSTISLHRREEAALKKICEFKFFMAVKIPDARPQVKITGFGDGNAKETVKMTNDTIESIRSFPSVLGMYELMVIDLFHDILRPLLPHLRKEDNG